MRPVLCLVGRHRWERRRNPDQGGKDAVYEVCGRCGKDRPGYEPPSPGAMPVRIAG